MKRRYENLILKMEESIATINICLTPYFICAAM